tara:strand:+ start:87 stop:725 length:639 start_codon:yes stop_codon:yes gene_type:complete
MEYREIEISKLKESKYNPKLRTDKANSKYRSLRRNIETNGLLVPIVADRSFNVVDGHRRLSCMRDLGSKTIPTFVNRRITSKNFDHMFVAANDDTMTISASQETERYLMGAPVVSKKVLKAIKALEKIGGRSVIKTIARMGNSPNTYLIGIGMYCNYTKKNTRKDERKALYWMLNVGSGYKLKSAIYSFVNADYIADCVDNRKQIDLELLSK